MGSMFRGRIQDGPPVTEIAMTGSQEQWLFYHKITHHEDCFLPGSGIY